MTHFLLLLLFAAGVALLFGVYAGGTVRNKVLTATKVFFEFVGIGLVLAWIFYFLPGQ